MRFINRKAGKRKESKKYRKVFSFLLVFCMLISAISLPGVPMEVLAKDTEKTESPLVLENEKFGVTVSIADAAIPEGVKRSQIGLNVEQLTKKQIKEAAEVAGMEKDNVLVALDISLCNTETKKEIQPAEDETVSVTIQDVKEIDTGVAVTRINDDDTATTLEADLSENDDDTHDVTFETEHFTTYLVATVSEFNNAIANAATDGSETIIQLSSDITFTNSSTIVLPANSNIKITGSGQTLYRSANLAGSMFRVPSSATLTLGDGVTLDASNGEYTVVSGAKQESNRGVFVNVQGTLNIEGVVMTGVKTTGTNAANYVTPVYVTGSNAVVNFKSGTIKDMVLKGNMNNGGNQHSAGGFIVAGDATLNMTGGSIENNNVNWSDNYLPFFTNNNESLLLEPDASGGNDNHMNATRAHTADLTKTESGIWMGDNKNRGLTYGSTIQFQHEHGQSYNYTDIRVSGGTEVEKTNSAGAVLILKGTMNFNGGEIKNNKADTGAIGIGGSDAWDTADYVSEGANRSKVLNMNGGLIDNNMGIYAGGVFVSPRGLLNLNNGTISRNKSVLYGGGITAMRKDLNNSSSDPYWPAITMKGGLIQNNRTRYKGGAMFLLVDEKDSSGNLLIDLQGGTMDGNVADMMGGAIYLDEGYHLTINAYTEISGNEANDAFSGAALHYESDPIQARLAAGAGGGVWLCPEGESNSNSLGYLYVHDNSASDAGDDMYKVIQSGWSRDQAVQPPVRDALGGLNSWYRDGGYNQAVSEMVNHRYMWRTSVNTYYDRYNYVYDSRLDQNTSSGEKYFQVGRTYNIIRNGNYYQVSYTTYPRYSETSNPEVFTEAKNQYDAFAIKNVMQGTEEEVTTRKSLLSAMSTLKITNNKSSRGGGIGSNGILNFGDVSEYSENDFTITKTWDDPTEATEIYIHPYIEISDANGVVKEVDLQKVTLNADNNFSQKITNLPYLINGRYLFEFDAQAGEYTSQLKFRETFPSGENSNYTLTREGISLISTETVPKNITQPNGNGNHTINVTTYHYGVRLKNTLKTNEDETEFAVGKTWDDDVEKKPVKVRLLDNGQPVYIDGVLAEVELTEEKNWYHKWTKLPKEGHNYTVEEVLEGSEDFQPDYQGLGNFTYTRTYWEDTTTTETTTTTVNAWREASSFSAGDQIVLVADSVTNVGSYSGINTVVGQALSYRASQANSTPGRKLGWETGPSVDSNGDLVASTITNTMTWTLEDAGNGRFKIKNKDLGRYLYFDSPSVVLGGTLDNLTFAISNGYLQANSSYGNSGYMSYARYSSSTNYFLTSGGSTTHFKIYKYGTFTETTTITVPGEPIERQEVVTIGNTYVINNIPKTIEKGEIKIVKVDADSDSIVLPNVLFDLYIVDPSSSVTIEVGDTMVHVRRVKQGLKTNNSGLVTADDLDYGDYYLVETTPPDGYVKLEEPIPLTLGADGVSSESNVIEYRAANGSTYVKNTKVKMFSLPDTGGLGFWKFSFGAILAVAAVCAGILYRKRRYQG